MTTEAKAKSWARKSSDVPARVWKYGVVTRARQVRFPEKNLDIGNRELVEEQLRLGNMYRNKLVELRRRSLIEYREAMMQFPDVREPTAEIQALTQEIEDLRTTIKAERADARARVKNKALAARVKELTQRRKALGPLRKAAMAAHAKDPVILKVQGDFHAAGKLARAESKLAWGTYLKVEEAVRATKIVLEPSDFRRYDGTGRLVVQVQKSKPLDTEGLLACKDRRVRLEVLPAVVEERSAILVAERWHLAGKRYRPGDTTPNGLRCYSKDDALKSNLGDRAQLLELFKSVERLRQHAAILHLRIGSDRKGRPVWATFPIDYHRPLPPLAQIKWVWVQRRKNASRGTHGHPDCGYVWQACFSLESKTFEKPVRVPSSVAAINFGFRLLDDAGSLRVAYLVGADGHREEYSLPAHGPRPRYGKRYVYPNGQCRKLAPGVWTGIAYANSKRASRDKNFNLARKQLVAWMIDREMPEWLVARTRTLPHWRRIEALSRLVADWQRFDGDEEIFSQLKLWAYKDDHDLRHESGLRSRSYARRDQQHTKKAIEWCKRYAVIRIQKLDLRKLKQRALPENGESELERVQRVQMNTSAIGELVSRLHQAAANLGTKIEIVDVAGVEGSLSATHYACGVESSSDRTKKIEIHCEHCAVDFDQDENFALNLLTWKGPPCGPEDSDQAAAAE